MLPLPDLLHCGKRLKAWICHKSSSQGHASTNAIITSKQTTLPLSFDAIHHHCLYLAICSRDSSGVFIYTSQLTVPHIITYRTMIYLVCPPGSCVFISFLSYFYLPLFFVQFGNFLSIYFFHLAHIPVSVDVVMFSLMPLICSAVSCVRGEDENVSSPQPPPPCQPATETKKNYYLFVRIK